MTGMCRLPWILMLGIATILPSMATDRAPVEVVPAVDLGRYQGKWYEVARLPNYFQRKCVGNVTAEYSLRNDGMIDVRNACEIEGGKTDSVEGVARPAGDGNSGSRLEVSFLPRGLRWIPFTWGDYWVIELGAEYEYAVVGTPSRKWLWILSRTPELDDATVRDILDRVAKQGFDAGAVVRTAQDP